MTTSLLDQLDLDEATKQHIRAAVDEAPPFSDETKAYLRRIFQGARRPLLPAADRRSA